MKGLANARLLLWATLIGLIYFIYVKEQPTAPTPVAITQQVETAASIDNQENNITIDTDVLKVTLNTQGDIVKTTLKKFSQAKDFTEPFSVLDNTAERFYILQSGIINPETHKHLKAEYRADKKVYTLEDGESQLTVVLTSTVEGLKVEKRYTFLRGDYRVTLEQRVMDSNKTDTTIQFYNQVQRKFDGKEASGIDAIQMYQGGAMYLPDAPFTKVHFDDLKKQGIEKNITGGWIASLERYFLAAIIPTHTQPHVYYGQAQPNHKYVLGQMSEKQNLTLGQPVQDTVTLYIGPEVAETLKSIAPGLDLTIDYGFLWPISQFLFWIMKKIQLVVGNWGLAIIGVTLCIKLAFFKLSAVSVRSMRRMKNLQPKIQQLKDRFGDNKQEFSRAMMELYKREKVNPLGGCLPILVQIPVFIALYYVLLESVELRHAPFFFWITDLSSKDPYYLLPLFMGASMFLQQRMNPTPVDPVQAKMFLFMPVIFTALFLNFPSGLMLYWLFNNILSMLQQWLIQRQMD